MIKLIDKMRPRIEETIAGLKRASFRVDPIAGVEFSRATSIVSASFKRHGRILEEALRLKLVECEYLKVWREPNFHITNVAEHAISGRNDDILASQAVELPYLVEGRQVEVDLIVFDRRSRMVRAYEVKRANGHHDSGKKRSLLKDVLCVQALLKSYAVKRGINAMTAESRVVAYYGLKPLPDPLCVVGEDLDDHFVFSVRRSLEEVNDYFRERVHQLLSCEAGIAVLNGTVSLNIGTRSPAEAQQLAFEV